MTHEKRYLYICVLIYVLLQLKSAIYAFVIPIRDGLFFPQRRRRMVEFHFYEKPFKATSLKKLIIFVKLEPAGDSLYYKQ
jgi:hypothetical protein